MKIQNKKGFSTIFIFVILAFILLVVYLICLIFKPSIASLVNYSLILILFFLIQGFFIYVYYKLGFYAVKGLDFYKKKITKFIFNTRKLIITYR